MQTESANTPEAAAPANLVELAIPTPDGVKVSDSMGIETYAQAFTITCPSDSVKAQEARARVNTRIKDLTTARMEQTRLLDAAKTGLIAWWGRLINPLENAKKIFDAKILAYDDAQEAIRKEAQRKADEIAETERKRLKAEADERQRKADADAAAKRKAADDAAAAGRTEDAAKLNAQADRVVENAAKRVEVLQERASQVVAPILQGGSAKASGSSFRDNWKFEVIDMDLINDGFKKTIANEDAINAIVKSMKGNAESIHAVVGKGIRIYNDRGLASKRA